MKKEIEKYSRKIEILESKVILEDEDKSERVQRIKITSQDMNFEKVWLYHLLDAINLLGGSKIKVLTTLLKIKSHDNLIFQSQREIAKEAGVTAALVNQTIKELGKADYLTMVKKGIYRINPKVIFKGNHDKRMLIIYDYMNESAEETKETKIDNDPETFVI